MLTHQFENAYIQIKQMLLTIDAHAPLSILHCTYGLTYIHIYVHLTCIFWSPYLLNVVVDMGCSENKDPQKLTKDLQDLRPKTNDSLMILGQKVCSMLKNQWKDWQPLFSQRETAWSFIMQLNKSKISWTTVHFIFFSFNSYLLLSKFVFVQNFFAVLILRRQSELANVNFWPGWHQLVLQHGSSFILAWQMA